MSAITIGGDLIHYEKLGKGRPVILLHGWIGSWRYWIPTMQTLHLSFTVYTLDLIGFGDSAKNEARYTIEEQSNMLGQFMERLGLPKAAIIGHGLGAMVATHFALHNPSRAARLMLSSLPLLNPGDLSERVPAGTQRLLTGGDKRYSLAPNLDTLDTQEAAAQTHPSTTSEPGSNPNKSTTQPQNTEMTIPSGGASSSSENAATATSTDDSGTTFNQMPTISPSQIDREALKQAAEDQKTNRINQLHDLFKDKDVLSLLDRCFKKTDPSYEKLKVDADRSDNKVLHKSAEGFEAGKMLDDLRRLTAPAVVIHGQDDPVLPAPSDEIWHYLTLKKDDVFVPIPLPNVRHFPMLEHETFPRLAKDFLEISEIKDLEVREIWKRRHF